MPDLTAKFRFILSRTHNGDDLDSCDRELIDKISVPEQARDNKVGTSTLSPKELVEFEKLFEFVRQNNSAPRHWLFDLEGLQMDRDGQVFFDEVLVDHFNLDQKPLDEFESFSRGILYPACLLAKRYQYRHLSIHRVPFFANELLDRYCLHPISEETYRDRESELKPASQNQFGFLFGNAAVTTDRGIPLHQPFLHLGGQFFFCERFISVTQFENIELPTWIANLPDDKKAEVSRALIAESE